MREIEGGFQWEDGLKERVNVGGEISKVMKHWCTVCDYVYDPEEGDPDSAISPGTPFEELPGDWVCPICGASKEDFEEVK